MFGQQKLGPVDAHICTVLVINLVCRAVELSMLFWVHPSRAKTNYDAVLNYCNGSHYYYTMQDTGISQYFCVLMCLADQEGSCCVMVDLEGVREPSAVHDGCWEQVVIDYVGVRVVVSSSRLRQSCNTLLHHCGESLACNAHRSI